MTETMHYLTELEQLKLQALSKWLYTAGVSRVQTLIKMRPKLFYFRSSSRQGKIAAYNRKTGKTVYLVQKTNQA